jgi:hypothetical protein
MPTVQERVNCDALSNTHVLDYLCFQVLMHLLSFLSLDNQNSTVITVHSKNKIKYIVQFVGKGGEIDLL